MKKILILFSLVIVSTGVILTNYSTRAQDVVGEKDTTIVQVEDQIEDNIVTESTVQDEKNTTKSTILLAGKKKSGFNILTIIRGLFGMVVLIMLAWLFSANRKKVDWIVIAKGLAIQLILAVSILYVPFVAYFFEFVGKVFVKILDFTKVGSTFLFGNLMDMDSIGMIFAFQILPTIIFFSALTSVLFYWGVIQVVVKGLAWVMVKTMKLSGSESLSVAGNIYQK